jgi:hypothetical protein
LSVTNKDPVDRLATNLVVSGSDGGVRAVSHLFACVLA